MDVYDALKKPGGLIKIPQFLLSTSAFVLLMLFNEGSWGSDYMLYCCIAGLLGILYPIAVVLYMLFDFAEAKKNKWITIFCICISILSFMAALTLCLLYDNMDKQSSMLDMVPGGNMQNLQALFGGGGLPSRRNPEVMMNMMKSVFEDTSTFGSSQMNASNKIYLQCSMILEFLAAFAYLIDASLVVLEINK